MYFSRLRTALIFGTCLFGVLFCLPNLLPRPVAGIPWRQIHLGLDLRGGSYLLLQVDLGAIARDRLASLADEVRHTLLARSLGYRDLAPDARANAIVFTPRSADERQADLAAIEAMPRDVPDEFAASARPDGTIAVTLSAAGLRKRGSQAVAQSIEIVRRRIDATGVVDPSIARQGADRIVVELPGISDPDRVRQLLGTTAKMTFQLVDENASPNDPAPPGDEVLPMQDHPPGTPAPKIVVFRHVDVDGADLTDAQAATNPQSGGWVVNFTFNGHGASRFADVTANNIGKRFAIVLDRAVISAPVIQSVIPGGRGQIEGGNFTAASATTLALLLRAGALPAPLDVLEQRSIGPELGADSIRAGALSLGVGFLLVIGFMGTFYGLFGWYAAIALVANLVLMTAILSIIGAVLTLPGMAGMLLTLGMAVDANILINERIREEVKRGRTPLAAMQAGFERAYSTIIDSNATAFLAHVMLFVFGTGPVRGFALTITVGIVSTLFTAVLVTRLLMVRWFTRRRPALLPV